VFAPRRPILGADIAGTVEAVGAGVTRFRPGDEVWGDLSAAGFGGFAEYVATAEKALAMKPKNLTFEEAAAVPLAGGTALQALRDKGDVRQGDKVLVNGAAGGVGTFAVQIAKSFGGDVTAVCSAGNADLVRGVGAGHVIDYAMEDFTDHVGGYDVIVDMIANHSSAALKGALAPGGRCVIVGFGSTARMLAVMLTGGRQIRTFLAMPKAADLDFLKGLIESGQMKPVIDRRYKLAELPAAIAYLEEGHARGKVVITMDKETRAAAPAKTAPAKTAPAKKRTRK
jgi:NADPH:quinone reductase-like Zn-dependent oxidoreductase